MDKTYNTVGIKSDLESLCDYNNNIDEWKYHLDKYILKLGSLPKSSKTQVSTDDLKYLKQWKKEKNHVVQIYLKALKSDDFIKFVINSLGYDFTEDIVWNLHSIDREDMEQKFGLSMVEDFGYSQKYKVKYLIIVSNIRSYYSPIKFPPYINQRFQSFFETPSDYFPQPLSDSELSKANQVIFDGEKQALSLIPKLFYLSKNNFIKVGTTGKILKSSLNKINKEHSIIEIFAKKVHETTNHFVLKSLTTLLQNVNQNRDSNDVIGILKNILDDLKSDDYTLYSIIMEIYKGNPNGKHIGADYQGFFEALPFFSEPDKWYTSGSLMRYLTYRNQEIQPVELEYLSYLKLKFENTGEIFEIPQEANFDVILTPYLYGVLYVFAALGLVKTSSDDENIFLVFTSTYREEVVKIPYHALTYFKLTNLGRFVFGLDKNYDIPESTFKETQVKPDSNSLTISLSEKNEMIYSELLNYAKPIGDKLFLVSEKSILKKISAKYQLNDAIQRLEQLVTKPFPPHWIKFFKQLEHRFDPLIKVKGNFTLYKIPDGNPDLFHVLMTDKKLKSLYVKVENKQLLVKKKSLPQFKVRMMELGWVMEDN